MKKLFIILGILTLMSISVYAGDSYTETSTWSSLAGFLNGFLTTYSNWIKTGLIGLGSFLIFKGFGGSGMFGDQGFKLNFSILSVALITFGVIMGYDTIVGLLTQYAGATS